jgi:FHA domain/Transglycosylase SLT domain
MEMTNARLIVQAADKNPTEHEVAKTISIGSAADNQIRIRDQGVVPYHAIIVRANGSYLISEIGGSGVFVNGARIHADHPLRDGDVISIGEAAEIRFLSPAARRQSEDLTSSTSSQNSGDSPAAGAAADSLPRSPAVGGQSSGSLSWRQIALALTVGISLVGVVAILYLFINRKNCGVARVINPAAGTIVSRGATISVKADNPECVRRISYLLDGQPFASFEGGVFEAVLDPIKLREQAPQIAGGIHKLSVLVEGEESSQESEAVEITLDFSAAADGTDLDFIREKAEALCGQLSGGSGFVFGREFTERIHDRTRSFRNDIYAAAAQNKDQINKHFSFYGQAPLFGYILAASRSGFSANGEVDGCGVGAGERGFWRMPQSIVRQYAQANAQADQEARIAARHFDETFDQFNGKEDFMYAVACFGEPGARAGAIAQQLPEGKARRDFWQAARDVGLSPDEVSRVVCFIAAGIVAENPERFGMTSPRLSDLLGFSPPITPPAATASSTQPVVATSPPAPAMYSSMGEKERYDFLGRAARQITEKIGTRLYEFDSEVVGYIKRYVDVYNGRVGKRSTAQWGEDMNFVFERAIKQAPGIIAAFRQENVPAVIGLYIPMIESEYSEKCLKSPAGAVGMFQFIRDTAIEFNVHPDQRCDNRVMMKAAARYMKKRLNEFGPDAMGAALAVAAYNRGPGSVRDDLGKIVNSRDNERAFWTLIARKEELDRFYQNENVKYVPKFFAAAIIGENPRAFGLRIRNLSSYDQPVSER